eukprot:g10291.t1
MAVWATVCYAVTKFYVAERADLASVPLFSYQCPALEQLGGLHKQLTDAPASTLAGPSIHRELAGVGGPGGRSTYDYLGAGGLMLEEGASGFRDANLERSRQLLSLPDIPGLPSLAAAEGRKAFKVLELQRYEFALLAYPVAWFITLFTMGATILFAFFQKREVRVFDSENADMADYCFKITGLPRLVLNTDEFTEWIEEKLDLKCETPASGARPGAKNKHGFMGVSLAHDYDELKVLPRNGLTLDDICDKVVARADKRMLRKVYELEQEQTKNARTGVQQPVAGNKPEVRDALKITDFRFPSNWLYSFEYFLCFLSPQGKQVQEQLLQSKEVELEVMGERGTSQSTSVPNGAGLLAAGGVVGGAKESDPEMQRFVDVGLVAPDFTEEQAEEIRTELRSLKSAGVAYCFCDRERDVDRCVDWLQRAAADLPPPGAGAGSRSATKRALDDALAQGKLHFKRANTEPGDILWGNHDSSKSFLENWVYGPMRFAVQIVLYGLLMYAPAIIFILNSLQESANVPQGWAMTFLGILFSSGNGVIGLMFWNIAVALPFAYRKSQWLVVLVSYSALFILNTMFSVYIVFGETFFGEKADMKYSDPLGEEVYLGKQMYELLVPGTFLMPYFIWPLTGYLLRRLLRLYNSFIPFTDDVWSARVVELRKAELHLEPPMIYLAWDYAVNVTLPLCCAGMFYLACPRFTYLLFFYLIVWAVWMYFSQRYLHLMSSKTTFYSSPRLSTCCFEMFALIVGCFAGAIPWWEWRARKFHKQVEVKLSAGGDLKNHAASDDNDDFPPFDVGKFFLYFVAAAGFYLFVLYAFVRPKDIMQRKLVHVHKNHHISQNEADGAGVRFEAVEAKLGINFENTNPVLVLKSHFLSKEDCAKILARRGGKSIMPFRVGKQYLLFSYDVDLMKGRVGDMWDMGLDTAGMVGNLAQEGLSTAGHGAGNFLHRLGTGTSMGGGGGAQAV